MSATRTEISQILLGMKPYVLIEWGPASDGSGEPAITVKGGGGLDHREQIADTLALALVELLEQPDTDPRWQPVWAALDQVIEAMSDEQESGSDPAGAGPSVRPVHQQGAQ